MCEPDYIRLLTFALTKEDEPTWPVALDCDNLEEQDFAIASCYWMRGGGLNRFEYSVHQVASMFDMDKDAIERRHCSRIRLIFNCSNCLGKFAITCRSHFNFTLEPQTGNAVLCHRCKLGIGQIPRKTMNVLGSNPEKRTYFLRLTKAFPIVLPNYPLASFIDSKEVAHLFDGTASHRSIGYFLRCRVHFVACDLEGNPILAGKFSKKFLDDPKNEFKREVLSAAGIPYYLFPAHEEEVFRIAQEPFMNNHIDLFDTGKESVEPSDDFTFPF